MVGGIQENLERVIMVLINQESKGGVSQNRETEIIMRATGLTAEAMEKLYSEYS